jgi:hypothetical protein
LDRLGLVQNELTWNTFSFYATRWWTACRDYIFEERREQREENGALSFTEFEKFAERLMEQEAKKRKKARATIEPGAGDVQKFLKDEAALGLDES